MAHMAGSRHVIHIPEDYSDKDMSRPLFERASGRIGLYVELSDAVAADPHEYGSHVYFLRDIENKLDAAMRNVSLTRVKGEFERNFLFNGAIFEEYHDNRVISVSFTTDEDLRKAEKQYQQELIAPCIQAALVTPELLSAVGVVTLTLECRMWEDEIEDCADDIRQRRLSVIKLENSKHDQDLIRGIKQYLPTLTENLMILKDNLNKFDKNLGEFIMIMKQNLPKHVEKICTYDEYLELIDGMKKRKPEAKFGRVLDIYSRVRACVQVDIAQFEDHVLFPLLQVHLDCDTSYQRDLKIKIRNLIRETKSHLKTDYDFYNLNHKEWQAKVLHNEQRLFLGLISVLPKSVSTLIDCDTYVDEYLSALTTKIRV